LSAWARQILTDLRIPTPWPRVDAERASRFLLGEMEWFRHNTGTSALIDWLGDQAAKARRLILGPSDKWYVGTCGATLTDVAVCASIVIDMAATFDGQLLTPTVTGTVAPTVCTAEMFVAVGRDSVTCKTCETAHSVIQRRDQLIASAWTAHLPLNTILNALPTLIGVKVNRTTARAWRHDRPYRKPVPAREGRPARPAQPFQTRRLHAQGLTLDGVETFKVGDVITLAHAANRRSAKRTESERVTA
jgi:hypothetical protein